VSEASVATFAPSVQFSGGRDDGAMSSSARDVHNVLAAEAFDHSRTVTGPGTKSKLRSKIPGNERILLQFVSVSEFAVITFSPGIDFAFR